MTEHKRRHRWARSRSATAVGLATAFVLAAGAGELAPQLAEAALPSGCDQNGLAVTCTYTSGSNAFVVPDGVTTVHVVAVGGAGGSTSNADGVTPGGLGAQVTGDLSVTPGSTLYAVVGGNADNGAGFFGSTSAGGANGGGDGQFSGGG